MKTKREKQLEIALLKERIERLSNKKVVFKEGSDVSNSREQMFLQRELKNYFQDILSDKISFKFPEYGDKKLSLSSYSINPDKIELDFQHKYFITYDIVKDLYTLGYKNDSGSITECDIESKMGNNTADLLVDVARDSRKAFGKGKTKYSYSNINEQGQESYLDNTEPELISDVIEEEVIEEIFGLSKEEKERKQLEKDIVQATREVNLFNFQRLFRQMREDSNKTIIKLDIKSSLEEAEKNLPTLKKLLPDLFNETEAVIVYYKLTPTNKLKGIIPKGFYSYVVKDNEVVNNFGKPNLKKELNNLLNKEK